MVHGTFATNFVRENYRNMCHLWRLDGTRTWIYGLMFVPRCVFGLCVVGFIRVCPACLRRGAFVVMRVASSTGPSENRESLVRNLVCFCVGLHQFPLFPRRIPHCFQQTLPFEHV
jgi:hypothetical protein